MLFTVQCEVIDSDLLNNPNAVSPEEVDPNFLLNNIQMQTRAVYTSAAGTGRAMTRMGYMFGSTYGNAYAPTSFNAIHQTAYSSVLIDINNLLEITGERELFFHQGMAKVFKAYTLMVMVDVFGDMPYSEALLGAERLNPELDSGSDIYAAALELLDEAVADLQNTDRVGMPANDLYFSGSTANKVDRWVRVANTLKLKAYLNLGEAGPINDLVANGADNLIWTNSHNWTFDYSTTDTNPDSRHPLYSGNYVDLASAYMSVGYMNMLLNDKGNLVDPRLRYYMYRQTNSDTDDTSLNTCAGSTRPTHYEQNFPNAPYCFPGGNGEDQGWWGRDHLIDDGIPPDRGLRTTYGVYPAGGQFDANQAQSVDDGMGLQGAGFEPIMMASFTRFMIAEAIVRLGASGNAEEHLEEAVRLSMEAVRDFGEPVAVAQVNAQINAAVDALEDPEPEDIEAIEEEWNALLISDEDIDDYWNVVQGRFGGDQVGTIAMEFYLALWPNGYEAYNLMRRTDRPNATDNLQPAQQTANPGTWYRSFLYPANLVNRNANVSQKTNVGQGPFWDPNSGSTTFNF